MLSPVSEISGFPKLAALADSVMVTPPAAAMRRVSSMRFRRQLLLVVVGVDGRIGWVCWIGLDWNLQVMNAFGSGR